MLPVHYRWLSASFSPTVTLWRLRRSTACNVLQNGSNDIKNKFVERCMTTMMARKLQPTKTILFDRLSLSLQQEHGPSLVAPPVPVCVVQRATSKTKAANNFQTVTTIVNYKDWTFEVDLELT